MAFDISRFIEELATRRRSATRAEGWRPPVTPASVYLLADNLDAALAAGEDLLKESFVWNAGSSRSATAIAGGRAELRASIETVRSLEMVLVARVLKTRERAEELSRHDARFKPVAKLYNSGTAHLIEASVEFGDATVHDFETGDATTAYLRTRGLIAPDYPAPDDGATVTVTEDFLVARRIRLGQMLDLIAMFLDTLETHYELYDLDDDGWDEIEPSETDDDLTAGEASPTEPEAAAPVAAQAGPETPPSTEPTVDARQAPDQARERGSSPGSA